MGTALKTNDFMEIMKGAVPSADMIQPSKSAKKR